MNSWLESAWFFPSVAIPVIVILGYEIWLRLTHRHIHLGSQRIGKDELPEVFALAMLVHVLGVLALLFGLGMWAFNPEGLF